MRLIPSNVYESWRASTGAIASLHEGDNGPPERLLQAVWWHQRLRREELRSTDGRAVRVLHPGFWNRGAGPDFRDAVIQFEHEPPVSGDVEVDLRSRGWREHHHHSNPEYRKVILHVVWEASIDSAPPQLCIAGSLDAPLAELAAWLGGESARQFPVESQGHCCAPLRDLSADQLDHLLRQASAIRFQSKARQIQARARQAGWEQSLWESLFRALGYKQNVWPMQRLGELRPRIASTHGRSFLDLQARLLGVGGLLPEELPGRTSRGSRQVRDLWDLWWRQRAELDDATLPRSLWKFSGLRPSNRPERRLALAAHWIATGTLPSDLESWCMKKISDSELVASLSALTHVQEDGFWSWHWTFHSPRLAQPQPLLGAMRLTDLAVNAVLPWLWIRAVEGKNTALQEEIERRYFAWPAAEDNAILRLARQRLLGTPSKRSIRNAAGQQGLMQIVRDFCEQSNAVCAGCKFPGLVQEWGPK